MRDPERIRPFLEELASLWLKNNDYRFGQLIMNLCRDKQGGFLDPWNWEEEEWLKRIKNYDGKES